jgi:HAD superfamily hydrolase (TIGR01484 family)
MLASKPLDIHQISPELCRGLTHLFTDIDDTITTEGQLTAGSYAALWDLERAGIGVVLVTGRPAGWCDFFARMLPVVGVVGENGAFYFAYHRAAKRMARRYLLSSEERREGQRRLERIKERVLREVPGSAVAADQPYRITDLAIDFCEDVEPLPRAQVRRIASIAEEEGAVAKISSIHVNCWYGEFDKITCAKVFLQEEAGLGWQEAQKKVLYSGDSPNDEPMFAGLENTVGVANLVDFLEDMTALPRYMTSLPSGQGFQELAAAVLAARG